MPNPQSRSLACRSDSDACDLPDRLVTHYREMLRAYVVMGAGNLADEMTTLARLLADAGISAQRTMQLHVHVLEELIGSLGNRSARHVMNRADLLVLEVMAHLADGYRRRYHERCHPPRQLRVAGLLTADCRSLTNMPLLVRSRSDVRCLLIPAPAMPPSDATTTVAELRKLIADFVAERDWSQFHSPKNVSMALAIEAAELMEHSNGSRPRPRGDSPMTGRSSPKWARRWPTSSATRSRWRTNWGSTSRARSAPR